MNIYLDHNATTPVRPECRAAMLRALDLEGNASSVHQAGRQAKGVLEDARDQVAALAGAKRDEITFTSGGTEANNLVLKGAGRARILASGVEHAAVLKGTDGIELIPVDVNGLVDLTQLEAMLKGGDVPALVSVMVANNETGVIQPVKEVVEIAHRYDALVHTDAVQAAGKIDLDFADLDVDFMTLSAHKIGGAAGTGALVMKQALDVQAQISGGGQERGRRAGTENVAGIAGFGAAAVAAKAGLQDFARLAGLRDGLEAKAKDAFPDAVIFAEGVSRLPNTSQIAVPGVRNETLLMALDLDGFAVSAGSACSSGKVSASHVLAAMGVEKEIAQAAIRVSLGWNTKDEDVDAFVDAWARQVGQMKTKASAAVCAA